MARDKESGQQERDPTNSIEWDRERNGRGDGLGRHHQQSTKVSNRSSQEKRSKTLQKNG